MTNKSIKYKYKIFGLNIISDFNIDNLASHYDDVLPDVEIVFGNVPTILVDATVSNDYFQANENQFVLNIMNVGRFFIENGNKITIEPSEKGSTDYIRLYLLGSACGVLLFQRGVLPIHGSGIVINGGCVVFTGDSGAGKSTISAALKMKGHRVITDDVVATIICDAGNIVVNPSFPQQKLWKDCIEKLGVNLNPLQQVSHDFEKYYFPFDEGFQDSQVPLLAICELIPIDTKDAYIEKVNNNIEKLDLLIRNTYRKHFIKGLSIQKSVFSKWGLIANKIPMYKMYRPNNQYTTNKQILLIIDQLDKLSF